jgi:hypothetical protein
MLNEDKISILQQLTNECPFTELKKLLEKAIPRWISGEITPKRYDHGLSTKDEIFVCYGKHACLVGTALVGEKSTSVSLACKNLFNIDDDLAEIMMGFDTKISYSGVPIRDYVAKISKVIFN